MFSQQSVVQLATKRRSLRNIKLDMKEMITMDSESPLFGQRDRSDTTGLYDQSSKNSLKRNEEEQQG